PLLFVRAGDLLRLYLIPLDVDTVDGKDVRHLGDEPLLLDVRGAAAREQDVRELFDGFDLGPGHQDVGRLATRNADDLPHGHAGEELLISSHSGREVDVAVHHALEADTVLDDALDPFLGQKALVDRYKDRGEEWRRPRR